MVINCSRKAIPIEIEERVRTIDGCANIIRSDRTDRLPHIRPHTVSKPGKQAAGRLSPPNKNLMRRKA